MDPCCWVILDTYSPLAGRLAQPKNARRNVPNSQACVDFIVCRLWLDGQEEVPCLKLALTG